MRDQLLIQTLLPCCLLTSLSTIKELTQKLIATELEGREYLMAELDKAGYEYVFQGGNYVTIKAKTDAETVAERLLTEKKISIKTSGLRHP